jgi:hypothetical protein
MPIIKKDDIAPQRPVVIVIYGTPGSGKTSVANTADQVVMIDCDRGFDRAAVRVDTITARTWEEIIAEESILKNYKTVSVDTAKSCLDDFLALYAVKRDYKLKTNKQKMYGFIGDEFKEFVNRRREEGADLIFVAHDKEDVDKDITRHSPDVTGQSKNLLLRIADQVGYIRVTNNKRVISFDPTEEYIGKNVAELPQMEIPEKDNPAFQTFMAGIIKQVKEKIQAKTESQKKALEKIAEMSEKISSLSTTEEADSILKELNELPKAQQVQLKKALQSKTNELKFEFDKENNKFKIASAAE